MENLFSLEIALTLLLQKLGEWLWLTTPMKFFTAFGQEEFFIIVLPLFYWCIDTNIAISIALMLFISNTLNSFLKFTFQSPRPYWIDTNVKAFVSESSFGFPSNHAQISTSLWGLLFMYCKKTWGKIIIVILILMIGISRIYLGVHFFHDVFAGWLLGLMTIIAFLKLNESVSKWINRFSFNKQIIICVIASLLIVLFIQLPLFLNTDQQIPLEWIRNAGQSYSSTSITPFNPSIAYSTGGTFLGFSIGVLWLKHRSKTFSSRGTIRQKLLRYMIGVLGTFLIWYGMSKMLPTSPDIISYVFRYARYLLLGLWVSGLSPIIFERLGLSEFPAPTANHTIRTSGSG